MDATIEIYQRYITNSQEEIAWYDQMGLPLPVSYNYKLLKFDATEISDVRKYKGSNYECIVYFNDGFKIVAKANADEIFIQINDIKNGLANE